MRPAGACAGQVPAKTTTTARHLLHRSDVCPPSPSDGPFNITQLAISEDGNRYAIQQGGVLKQRIFLELAIGAAYAPVSLGPDGKVYSLNAGHLFVVGD